MPKSEIDDIFASKGKLKAVEPSKSISASASSKKKKRRDKKHIAQTLGAEVTTTKKRSPPETVLDPSAPVTKRVKVEKPSSSKQPCQKSRTDDSDKFRDSRGMSSRKMTEEGWAVYKEDELGISNEGGDTPDCPFDCTCCF